MASNPFVLAPGVGEPLRRLVNVSKQPAKVIVAIAPGDELEVSADLGAQLCAVSPSLRYIDEYDPAAATQARLDATQADDEPAEEEPEVVEVVLVEEPTELADDQAGDEPTEA